MRKNRLPLITGRFWVGVLVGLAFLVAAGINQANALPTFYVHSGINPNLDLTWQSAVGSFVEDDLDAFPNGTIVCSLVMGGVTVIPSIPADPTGGAEIYWGDYLGGGGQYGTVANGALLTRSKAGMIDIVMDFFFSTPVLGFGLWVFDDGVRTTDSFQMTANGFTSGVLDANPGVKAHTVEGFLGVVDPAGLTKVTISNVNTSGWVFEADHLQLAPLGTQPIPEPSTLLLVAGLAGLVGFNWRKRKA